MVSAVWTNRVLLGLLISLMAGGLSAQERLSVGQSRSPLLQDLKKPSLDIKVETGLQTFISSDTEYFSSRNASNQLSFATVGIYHFKSNLKKETKFDFETTYSAQEDHLYFNLREAFYTKKNKRSGYTLGRKKFDWFKQDDLWKTGTWFPRYARDKINAESQGLLVAAYTHQGPRWSFSTFVIPAHIPEVDPAFEQSNGKFVSENPWFRAPLSEIDIVEVPGLTKIDFKLAEIDPWEDVSNHQGLGFNLGYKRANHRFNGGYAYKPMNKIMLGFPFEMQIGGPSDKISVVVQPRVSRHHVASTEYEVTGKQWDQRYGLTYEVPEESDVPSRWISQHSERALYASSYWGLKISDRTTAYASLFHLWGGQTRDVGPNIVSQNKSFFEDRFYFSSALMLGLKTAGRVFKKPTELGSSFIFDRNQNGAVFSTDLKMQWSQKFLSFIKLDLLGLISEGEVENDNGLIRNFRANDQVTAGISYVF